MFVCSGHVHDDPGERCAGTRAWHPEIPGGARRHEPFRFHKEGVGACGGASDDAGMVGSYPASQADSSQDKPCTADPRAARRAMIVLDASVIIELLTNGAM